jgi:hypothetical protein
MEILIIPLDIMSIFVGKHFINDITSEAILNLIFISIVTTITNFIVIFVNRQMFATINEDMASPYFLY